MIGQKGLPAHSGGVERHVEDLATRLVAEGVEVVVYARTSYSVSSPAPESLEGVRLVYLPTLNSKHFEMVIHVFLSTIHALCDRRVSVMHYHGIGPSLFCWIPRLLRPSMRVIVTFHCQDYYHQKWGALARTIFRIGEVFACAFSHELIAVSQTIREYVAKTYGREAHYIPNAVPLREKHSAHHIGQWGLTTGEYLLCVARLVKHKGIHTVIQSYTRAIAGVSNPPKLVIVGAPAYTEDYERSLKKAAERYPSILFLGEQGSDILAELYSNARLFIQASESEGLSYTLLEAMSYGCPVLVSDIPEHKELVQGEQALFENKNGAHLTQKLQEFFNYPHPVSRLAANHRDHVRELYNVEHSVQNALRLYTAFSA